MVVGRIHPTLHESSRWLAHLADEQTGVNHFLASDWPQRTATTIQCRGAVALALAPISGTAANATDHLCAVVTQSTSVVRSNVVANWGELSQWLHALNKKETAS
jgi:hypothetical protein